MIRMINVKVKSPEEMSKYHFIICHSCKMWFTPDVAEKINCPKCGGILRPPIKRDNNMQNFFNDCLGIPWERNENINSV